MNIMIFSPEPLKLLISSDARFISIALPERIKKEDIPQPPP